MFQSPVISESTCGPGVSFPGPSNCKEPSESLGASCSNLSMTVDGLAMTRVDERGYVGTHSR